MSFSFINIFVYKGIISFLFYILNEQPCKTKMLFSHPLNTSVKHKHSIILPVIFILIINLEKKASSIINDISAPT